MNVIVTDKRGVVVASVATEDGKKSILLDGYSAYKVNDDEETVFHNIGGDVYYFPPTK